MVLNLYNRCVNPVAKIIKLEDKRVRKCEVGHGKEEPVISLNVQIPVGYAGTEVIISRDELLRMIDALNEEW